MSQQGSVALNGGPVYGPATTHFCQIEENSNEPFAINLVE